MREVVEKKVLSENDRLAGGVAASATAEQNIPASISSASPVSGKRRLLEKRWEAYCAGHASRGSHRGLQDDNERPVASCATAIRCGDRYGRDLPSGCRHWSKRHLNNWASSRPRVLLVGDKCGNLVWPIQLTILGEAAKIVLLSVTGRRGQAAEISWIFTCASLMILTKTDAYPHVEFDPRARPGKRAKDIRRSTTWALLPRLARVSISGLAWLSPRCQQKTRQEATAGIS